MKTFKHKNTVMQEVLSTYEPKILVEVLGNEGLDEVLICFEGAEYIPGTKYILIDARLHKEFKEMFTCRCNRGFIKLHGFLRPTRSHNMVVGVISDFLSSLGGNWVEKLGGVLFVDNEDIGYITDSMQLIELSDMTEKIRNRRYQYYPTPEQIAILTCEIADVQPNDTVIEPSAGTGALLEHIKHTDNITAIELDKRNADILRGKGFKVIEEDFLSADLSGLKPTKFIMNPPFKNAQDIKHIMHAYSTLEPHGMLVAIINESTLYYKQKVYVDFREWLSSKNHEVIELPLGCFKGSDTSVSTTILKIIKGDI